MSHSYEAAHREYHLQRPGFRISELRISPTRQVPWHYPSSEYDFVPLVKRPA